MFKAAGFFGKPGIVMTSPVRATRNPAPIEGLNSRIVIENPSGLPINDGSSDKEYYVFAMQIGRLPQPNFSKSAICFFALEEYSTLFAP